MSKVIKCDRCGKIYEEYEDLDNGRQVAFGHDEDLYKDLFTTYYIYDLCPDCIKAVQEFIEHSCDAKEVTESKDCDKLEDDEEEYQEELDEHFLGKILKSYLIDPEKLKEKNKDGIRILISSYGMIRENNFMKMLKEDQKKKECSKDCSLNHPIYSGRYPWGHVKREFASKPVKNHYFWKFLKWLDERDIKMTIKSSLLMSQSMDFDFEHGDKHIRTTIHYDYLDFDNPNNDTEEFIKSLKKLVVKGLLEGEE